MTQSSRTTISVNQKERDIERKLHIITLTEETGNAAKACRYEGQNEHGVKAKARPVWPFQCREVTATAQLALPSQCCWPCCTAHLSRLGDLEVSSGAHRACVTADLDGHINQRGNDADAAEKLGKFCQDHGFFTFSFVGMTGGGAPTAAWRLATPST